MLKSKSQALLAMLSLISLPALSSCASWNSQTPTTSTVNSVCTVWKIIPYHGNTDAPDTVERIRENNAARRVICPAG